MHDHCYYDVVLIRKNNHDLGLGLRGAKNSDGKLAIVVSEIMPNSPAIGKINIGDRIISVNGQLLDHLEYDEAIGKLRSAGRIISLQLTRCVRGRSSSQCITTIGTIDRHYVNGPQASNHQIATDQSQISLFMDEPSNNDIPKPYSTYDAVKNNRNDQEPEDTSKHNLFKTVHLTRRDNAESLGVELVSRIFVKSVDEGGLGECSGLRSGDRLVSLNGINAAHLSLVDTANMLRRQETVIEVAREPSLDSPSTELQDTNEEKVKTSQGRLNVVRRQRKHRDRYRPRPTTRLSEDVQFSSLREIPHETLPLCRQCSATYSLDEEELFHSSNSDDHLFSRLGTRGTLPHCGSCIHGMNTSQSGFNQHTALPHHRSWTSLISTGQHTYQAYQSQLFDDQWGYADEMLDLSNDNSTSNETVTPAHGYPRLRRIAATGKHSADAAQGSTVPTDTSNRIRAVRFCVDPHRGTGMSLVGGNLTGVFVSSVQPDSVADQAGIGEADQILKINGLDLSDWTKEEIALALIADDGPVVLELMHDPVNYMAVRESHEACDSMYVRAYFTLWPKPTPADRQATATTTELPISEGDIFHVVDTFVDGVFGNWLALKVYPTHSSLGIIPNWQRAEEILLEEDRRAPSRSNPVSLPPYERVIQISTYPLPRPVVLYGPLAALARRKLSQLNNQTSIDIDALGTVRFELPPVNAAGATGAAPLCGNLSSEDDSTTGVIRLSAIKRCMTENGSHCLIDLNLTAINRLLILGIPPIVILISPTSREQLCKVLEQYWDVDRTSPALFRPRKPLRKRSEVKELAEKLWKDVMHLRHFKSHLLTDTVPLIPLNGQTQTFSETDWLRNLISVIVHQQKQPVWIGEETQLAQDLLEKFTGPEKIEEPPRNPPTMPKTNEPSTETINSLNKELERLNKLTTQMNHLNESKGSELHNNWRKVSTMPTNTGLQSDAQVNTTEHFHSKVEPTSRNPLPDTTHSNAAERWPTANTVRPPVPIDLEETDISWASDFPQPPDEASLISPRQDCAHQCMEDRGRQKLQDCRINTTEDWDTLPSSDRIIVRRVPKHFLLDAFGICVHSTTEESPLSTNRASVTIEEVADAATLTSPRDMEVHNSRCPPVWNKNRLPCPSQSSTLDRTTSVELGSPDEHHSTVSSVPFTSSKSILAECAGEFGQEGGALELPEHQVRLYIPPGALPPNPSRQRLFLRVYDSNPEWGPQLPNQPPARTQRLISPLVMCGPRGLRFRVPLELTVPRYHPDSDSATESDASQSSRSRYMSGIRLLHTSSFSTSTSADEDSSKEQPDSNKTHYATWHEIPLVRPNQMRLSGGVDCNTGIKSVVRSTTIAILIDHF